MANPFDPSVHDRHTAAKAPEHTADADARPSGYAETIARQRKLIEEQAADLAHSQKIFNRASEAARIGVWECALPDDTLQWTDVVYDLFDLPRGAPLHRPSIVECYTEESARELEERRSRAIAELSGFVMDAAIVTFKGNHRWLRITATVECEGGVPVRIFGMKQDITEEKSLLERTRYLAEYDVMTGLANRSLFQSALEAAAIPATGRPSLGALLIVDLDGFKQINDTFGHAVGDACLQLAAGRLQETCEGAALVARIGGDEFGVLITERERALTALLAQRIVDALSCPYKMAGRTLTLGASVGAALAQPANPLKLFNNADTALYAAKNAGRNTFRLYSPEMDRHVRFDATA